MKFKKSMILLVLAVFIISMSCVCAGDAAMAGKDNSGIGQTIETTDGDTLSGIDDENDLDVLGACESTYPKLSNQMGQLCSTDVGDNALFNHELIGAYPGDGNSILSQGVDEIEVESWDDIRYYSSRTDKNYVLKLKENTNYYPEDVSSKDCQIIFRNNVTIIGAHGAYIGDASPDARNITYVAMVVEDNSGIGITLKNITFKWIATKYLPDGVFCQMGGNAFNYIENCRFTDISTNLGYSSILHIKLGDVVVRNCTFVNCTTDFGCLRVCDPNDDPTGTCTHARMQVYDSYFEANYARTQSGCISNCGILTLSNSTFYRNGAFRWAGAIDTYGGANTALHDCNFTDNVAGWNGGALYTYGCLQIYNTEFTGNNCTTENGGGAIGACRYLHAPYIYIEDSLFKDNANNCWGVDGQSAAGRGGAISIMDRGFLEVRNTTFVNNSASMGTAICAVQGGLQSGSPDVILAGNRFINNTRAGDVLDIRLADSSYLEVRDNYYYNNSIEFKKLGLVSDERIGDDVAMHIDAVLKNPDSFESDILDVSAYDIYVNGVYNKTVTGRTFSINAGDGKSCRVYAVAAISNGRTNEIELGNPKECIYVSQKSGNDANDGRNRTAPVKTMARAIELARETGSIIVMDGKYSESNLTVDYNLSITGENNVNFLGNIPKKVRSIFTVTNGSHLSLSQIAFDKIVFTANTTYKDKRVILQDCGYLTIDNCTFNSISPSGNTVMVLIESPNVEVHDSKFTNNNEAGVYVILIRADEFLIDNCTFINNIASYTSADSLIRTFSEKSGVKGTVTDSTFKNNNVKAGCIYFGANDGLPLTVTNTKFIENTVGSSSDHSSCIKIETKPTLRVEGCLFKDNNNYGTKAAVIYSSSGSASVYVSQSIIIGNSYSNNNNLVFSASTANNLRCYKNLNGNWWGNTLENCTVAPPVYASACDDWLVLNMTSNATKLGYGQKALVSVNLHYAVDRYGESHYADTSNLPDFDLDAAAHNGTLSSSKVIVKKGSGDVEYTFQNLNSGSVTVSYCDVSSTMDFIGLDTSFLTADRFDSGLKITQANHVMLNATLADLDTGEAISGATVVFLLNNAEYANVTDAHGKACFDLSGIDVGKYIVNYRFDGNADYDKCNLTVNDKLIVSANPDEKDITGSGVILVNDTVVGENGSVVIQFLGDYGPVEGTAAVLFNDTEYIADVANGRASVDAGDEFDAGVYDISYEFLGGPKYGPTYERIRDTSKFTVGKADTLISYTNERNVITFNVSHAVMPTGTINVTLGDVNRILTLSDGVASYNFGSDIAVKGNYTLNATYGGDKNHKKAVLNDIFEITKSSTVLIEDVPEEIAVKIGGDNNPQFNFNVTGGGQLLTAGSISFDFAESGLGIISAGYRNGAWYARFSTSDAKPGEFEITLRYDGDGYYAPASTAFKVTVLPTVACNLKLGDDKVTADVKISADAQTDSRTFDEFTPLSDAGGNFTITLNDEIIATGTISNGVGSVSFDMLEPDNYEFAIAYGGYERYPASTASASLKIPRTSQWASVGGDAQNSGNSMAARDDSVTILWNASLNGDLINSAVIDSFGNIYVSDGENIYSFADNGTLIWSVHVESLSGGPGSSGIALYHDEAIISPQSGNEMFIFNATDGTRFGGNYVRASSAFAPVTGPDARVYTPTEYGYPADGQGYNGNYWVSVLSESDYEGAPYQFNQFLVEITGIAYGKQAMKASPSFDNQGYIYANTVKGFKIVDVATGVTVFSDADIDGVGRPVIDAENIAYVLDANINGIYAISAGGIIWKTPVTGGIGSTLAVDNQNGFIYAVNRQGTLCKYDAADGSETEVCSLNSTGVSIILDANSNVYVSTENGNVTAFSSDGDMLWTINLGSSITGQLAMNKKGVIYAVGDKTLYALGLDANLNVEAQNLTVFDNETITVTIAEGATGNVTITLNGENHEVSIDKGTATLDLGKLTPDNYTVTVSYAGDSAYSLDYAQTAFQITKADANITADVVSSIKQTIVNVTLSKKATGRVFVKIDGKTHSAEIKNDTAIITITDLKSGNYTAVVIYEGDNNYRNASLEVAVNVPYKENLTINASADPIIVGENATILVSGFEDAEGNVTAKIGNDVYFASIQTGTAKFIISGLTGNVTASITYEGDDNYNNASTTVDIVVNPKPRENATISIDAPAVRAGENASVTVTLPEDANGNVTIGNEIVQVVDGMASAVLTGLPVGNNTVSVAYSGDGKYNPIETEVTVGVSLNDASISVNNHTLDLKVDDNFTIVAVTLPEGLNVTYVADDSGVVSVDENGVVTALKEGTGNILVKVGGDGVYAENTTTVSVSVSKVPTQITVDSTSLDLFVGDEAVIVAVLTPADAGNVTFTSSDDAIGTVDAQGNVIADGKGQAIITVSFAGDDKYAAAENKTIAVTVSLNDASVTVDNDTLDLKVGETYKINATKNPDTILLDITYTSGNSSVVRVDENGIVTAVGEGSAIITVEVGDDEIYAKNSTSITVTVNKQDANATVSIPENVTVGDNSTVNVKLPSDATGNVTVKVDGEVVDAVQVTDGSADVTIPSLSAGNHTVEIAYSGDGKYNPSNETKEITVSKKETAPDITIPSDITVGDDSSVNVTLPSDAAGNVTLKVDGEVVDTVPVTDGTASVELPDLSAGNHTVEIAYSGDGKYNPSNETKEITVSKKDETPDITIPSDITVGDDSSVNVTLPSDATGNVTLKVDGEVVSTVPVTNGTASVELPILSAGNHTVEIAYSGDEKYSPVTQTKEITVSKHDTAPEIAVEGSNVDVKLPSDATGNVTLKVDGEVIDTVPVSNGTASVKLPKLSAGNHTVEIDYSGDDKYSSSTETTIVSGDVDSTKLAADNVTATYNVKKYLTITLTDSQGSPIANATVSVKLKSLKNYTTDANGQVKVKVSSLVPKTYTAKITFKGDDNYTGSSTTAKVTVKKAASKLTAKAKTFKTTTKTKKYTVTLKNSKGKALKNKMVYLKVKGKTYKAKTNSKGKATFKITKLNKAGKFKATVTFKGNDYYKKATKKVKITVKSVFKTISKGSKNKAIVKKIQRALKNNGYYLVYNGHYLKVDGIFWDYTEMAVKEFQHDKKLKVTGKVDEKTAKKLKII